MRISKLMNRMGLLGLAVVFGLFGLGIISRNEGGWAYNPTGINLAGAIGLAIALIVLTVGIALFLRTARTRVPTDR